MGGIPVKITLKRVAHNDENEISNFRARCAHFRFFFLIISRSPHFVGKARATRGREVAICTHLIFFFELTVLRYGPWSTPYSKM